MTPIQNNAACDHKSYNGTSRHIDRGKVNIWFQFLPWKQIVLFPVLTIDTDCALHCFVILQKSIEYRCTSVIADTLSSTWQQDIRVYFAFIFTRPNSPTIFFV